MFGPYPALVPDGGWPSVGILDALCRGMQGRANLTQVERVFVSGMAAQLSELVEACWPSFAAQVQVEQRDGFIVCSARNEDGTSHYTLPLEQAILTVLKDPDIPQHPPMSLPFDLARRERVLELLALTACLGTSPLGEGPWTQLGARDLTRRVAAVMPILASSCADHYGRLHPDEHLGQRPDLYRRLIWPLALCDGAAAFKHAGASLLVYLEGALPAARRSEGLFRNLARFPSATVRGAALMYFILDERLPVSGEVVEIASDHFEGRAHQFRQAAIALAADRGRNVDWLNGGANAKARFDFERQMSLLPLVYLPYAECADSENRELAEALVALEAGAAEEIIEERIRGTYRPPRLLFQLAMLKRWFGDYEMAEHLLQEIVRLYPEQVDAEFYREAGIGALALGRLEDAITRLERARAIAGNGQRVESVLGLAYAEAGRSEDAAALFGEAIANGHSPSEVLVSRAELQRKLGRMEGYARDLQAAAAVYPFNAKVVDRVMASYVDS